MTLRETIKSALGDDWTQEIENKLFMPLADFITTAIDHNKEQWRKDITTKLLS